MADITHSLGDWLRKLLEYNPETGEFFWLKSGHGTSAFRSLSRETRSVTKSRTTCSIIKGTL